MSNRAGQSIFERDFRIWKGRVKEKDVPVRGIEPRPRRWERRILTTRPRGSGVRWPEKQREIFSSPLTFNKEQNCSRPGSNRGPCACEAHVITTTPREHWLIAVGSFQGVAQQRPEEKNKVLPGFEPGTFCVLGRCDNHYTTAPVCQ